MSTPQAPYRITEEQLRRIAANAAQEINLRHRNGTWSRTHAPDEVVAEDILHAFTVELVRVSAFPNASTAEMR